MKNFLKKFFLYLAIGALMSMPLYGCEQETEVEEATEETGEAMEEAAEETEEAAEEAGEELEESAEEVEEETK